MKLFIDTANLEEIESLLKTGIIDGITTNPSLVAKVPKTQGSFLDRYVSHMKSIASLCHNYQAKHNRENPFSLSVEVFTEDPGKMVHQALDLKEKIIQEKGINFQGLAIKIPAPMSDSDGLKELEVVKELSGTGVDVNYTCCFSTAQLINGAKAGAKYVSLFYNRLIDFYKTYCINADPLDSIRQTRKYLDETNSKAEIIAGSIRYPRDITDCWDAGAHIVTAGYKHIVNMNKHPKTDESITGFLKDLQGWMK